MALYEGSAKLGAKAYVRSNDEHSERDCKGKAKKLLKGWGKDVDAGSQSLIRRSGR